MEARPTKRLGQVALVVIERRDRFVVILGFLSRKLMMMVIAVFPLMSHSKIASVQK